MFNFGRKSVKNNLEFKINYFFKLFTKLKINLNFINNIYKLI